MMFAKHQYVLKSFEDEDGNVLTTDNKDAEKIQYVFFAEKKSDVIDEEVSVYGISDNKYVEIKVCSPAGR